MITLTSGSKQALIHEHIDSMKQNLCATALGAVTQ